MKRVNFDRKEQRKLRHKRITNTLKRAENKKPRLVVTKTDHHIYAQIIDDVKGVTLASASSLELKLKANNLEAASAVGKDIAEKAKKAKIKTVVFDRGGYLYHGRVKALAEAARENGLQF